MEIIAIFVKAILALLTFQAALMVGNHGVLFPSTLDRPATPPIPTPPTSIMLRDPAALGQHLSPILTPSPPPPMNFSSDPHVPGSELPSFPHPFLIIGVFFLLMFIILACHTKFNSEAIGSIRNDIDVLRLAEQVRFLGNQNSILKELSKATTQERDLTMSERDRARRTSEDATAAKNIAERKLGDLRQRFDSLSQENYEDRIRIDGLENMIRSLFQETASEGTRSGSIPSLQVSDIQSIEILPAPEHEHRSRGTQTVDVPNQSLRIVSRVSTTSIEPVPEQDVQPVLAAENQQSQADANNSEAWTLSVVYPVSIISTEPSPEPETRNEQHSVQQDVFSLIETSPLESQRDMGGLHTRNTNPLLDRTTFSRQHRRILRGRVQREIKRTDGYSDSAHLRRFNLASDPNTRAHQQELNEKLQAEVDRLREENQQLVTAASQIVDDSNHHPFLPQTEAFDETYLHQSPTRDFQVHSTTLMEQPEILQPAPEIHMQPQELQPQELQPQELQPQELQPFASVPFQLESREYQQDTNIFETNPLLGTQEELPEINTEMLAEDPMEEDQDLEEEDEKMEDLPASPEAYFSPPWPSGSPEVSGRRSLGISPAWPSGSPEVPGLQMLGISPAGSVSPTSQDGGNSESEEDMVFEDVVIRGLAISPPTQIAPAPAPAPAQLFTHSSQRFLSSSQSSDSQLSPLPPSSSSLAHSPPSNTLLQAASPPQPSTSVSITTSAQDRTYSRERVSELIQGILACIKRTLDNNSRQYAHISQEELSIIVELYESGHFQDESYTEAELSVSLRTFHEQLIEWMNNNNLMPLDIETISHDITNLLGQSNPDNQGMEMNPEAQESGNEQLQSLPDASLDPHTVLQTTETPAPPHLSQPTHTQEMVSGYVDQINVAVSKFLDTEPKVTIVDGLETKYDLDIDKNLMERELARLESVYHRDDQLYTDQQFSQHLAEISQGVLNWLLAKGMHNENCNQLGMQLREIVTQRDPFYVEPPVQAPVPVSERPIRRVRRSRRQAPSGMPSIPLPQALPPPPPPPPTAPVQPLRYYSQDRAAKKMGKIVDAAKATLEYREEMYKNVSRESLDMEFGILVSAHEITDRDYTEPELRQYLKHVADGITDWMTKNKLVEEDVVNLGYEFSNILNFGSSYVGPPRDPKNGSDDDA